MRAAAVVAPCASCVLAAAALTAGAGEMTDPSRINNADGHLGLVAGRDDVAFIAAGGFADDLDSRLGRQELEQPAMAGRGIGQVILTARQVQLQTP